MEKAKIISLLSETFELEEGILQEDTVLQDLEEWDSMAKLALIVLASDEFSKKLTSDDIKNFVVVKDIIDYINK